MKHATPEERLSREEELATRQMLAVRVFTAFLLIYVLVSLPALLSGNSGSPGILFAACSWGPLTGAFLPITSDRGTLLVALVPWSLYIILCARTPLGRAAPWVHPVGLVSWHVVGFWRMAELAVGV